jgi:hypothetical protein
MWTTVRVKSTPSFLPSNAQTQTSTSTKAHLDWSEGTAAICHGTNECNEDSSHVDGQLELKELSNAVIHVAPPQNRAHNTRKVVVEDNDVRCLLRHVCRVPLELKIQINSLSIQEHWIDFCLNGWKHYWPVPAIPMASPTSASFNAGASFVPSPVTATTSPSSRSRCTNVCLSIGLERARTWRRGRMAMSSSRGMFRNWAPSRAMPCSSRIPHSRAMCLCEFPRENKQTNKQSKQKKTKQSININEMKSKCFGLERWILCDIDAKSHFAVSILSPVTIRTIIPAVLHACTAAGTLERRGSLMPTIASKVKSVSNSSSANVSASEREWLSETMVSF